MIARETSNRSDLLSLRASNPSRYPALLESSSCDAGFAQGRWDILFAFPQRSITAAMGGDLSVAGEQFLKALQQARLKEFDPLQNSATETCQQRLLDDLGTRLPFTGGWFIYLAYEIAAAIEPVLQLPHCDDGAPLAHAIRFPCAVLHDRKTDRRWIVGEMGQAAHCAQIAEDLGKASDARVDESASGSTSAIAGASSSPSSLSVVNQREAQADAFTNAVTQAKRYIIDGDIFQANLSRIWKAELAEGSAAGLFQRLRTSNPAPFAAFADLPGASIISSSPERLIRQRGDTIDTRPIAGTRRRGASDAEDAELMQRLIENPKERAEHIMLIDLERNDLGRVCRPGTVEVDELMAIESYAHVHHIVSNVRGKRQQSVQPMDVVRAVFPGGTITGCPKVRCMQIIAELENTGRGAYTGSLGYMNLNGDMDLNILIRSFVLNGKKLRWQAGAGIVADSDPARELEETRSKARGLLLALETAE